MKKRFLVLTLLLTVVLFVQSLYAEYLTFAERENVVVYYATETASGAKMVAERYLSIKRKLERTFGLELYGRPTVVLMKDSEAFRRYAGSDIIVAFALPSKNRVVIDYFKVTRRPFSLETVLEHEMCHLLLHSNLNGSALPKWLDEGASQWASDGITELILRSKRPLLDEAVLSGRCIPMAELHYRFPVDSRLLLLAYEESKSFVEYLIEEYGEEKLRYLFAQLRNGDAIDVALQKSFGHSLDRLERAWVGATRKKITWFTYVSNNVYEILFFAGALITIIGFIRFLRKKKRFSLDEEEQDSERC